MNKIRYFKPIYVSLLFILLFHSCTNSENIENNKVKLLNINYSITDSFSRAFVTDEEANITEALFLFYNKETDEYVDFGIGKASEVDCNFNLKIGENIAESEEYKVLIFGNFTSYSSLNYNEFVETHKSIKYNKLRNSAKAEIIDEERVDNPLPYAGELVDNQGVTTLFNLSNYDEQNLRLNYNIKFKRIVTRIDLLNLVPNDLTIKWAKVVNYRSESYYYNDLITGKIIENKKSTENSRGVKIPQDKYRNNQLVSQYIEGGLYHFPNVSQYIGQSDNSTSAILICGYYQNSSTKRYYRINIGRYEENQTFRDNSIYKIIIHSVVNNGDDSEEEAMRNKNLNIFYQVNTDWVADGSELVSDNNGNYLSVSTTTKSFKGTANDDFYLFVESNKGSDFSYAFLDENSPQVRYFDITKGDKHLKVSTISDNNSDERSNRIKITHNKNPELYKIITLTQRDNTVPGIIIDAIYKGKTERYTSDFTLNIDGETNNIVNPNFVIYLANKEELWRSIFPPNERITLHVKKPYGKSGDKLETVIGTNSDKHVITHKLQVYSKDVEPITITIKQAVNKSNN